MVSDMQILWETKKFARGMNYYKIFLLLANIYNLKSSNNKLE